MILINKFFNYLKHFKNISYELVKLNLFVIQKYLESRGRGKGVDAWKYHAPYDYIENILQHNIHKYLNIYPNMIKRWCIVGGYLGYEVETIRRNYPNVRFTIFEPSKRYLSQLKSMWGSKDYVEIVNKAVSNKSEKVRFFETSLEGNGSLLELGENHKKTFGSRQEEQFEVDSITLDKYFNKNIIFDVLQIDVQGAEMLVLEGAINVLSRTRAIFIEISVVKEFYKNGSKFIEIYDYLTKHGFQIALVGTNFNLDGNALFVKSKL